MSNVSSWLKKVLGIPENKIADTEIIAALSEQVARGKVGDLLKKLPDNVFASMYAAFDAEAVRRGQR